AASPMHRDMMPPSIDAAATVTCAGVTAASRQASPRVGDPADAGDSPRSRRAAGARYPVGHLLRPGELGGSITCCTAADSGPPFDLPLLLHVRLLDDDDREEVDAALIARTSAACPAIARRRYFAGMAAGRPRLRPGRARRRHTHGS